MMVEPTLLKLHLGCIDALQESGQFEAGADALKRVITRATDAETKLAVICRLIDLQAEYGTITEARRNLQSAMTLHASIQDETAYVFAQPALTFATLQVTACDGVAEEVNRAASQFRTAVRSLPTEKTEEVRTLLGRSLMLLAAHYRGRCDAARAIEALTEAQGYFKFCDHLPHFVRARVLTESACLHEVIPGCLGLAVSENLTALKYASEHGCGRSAQEAVHNLAAGLFTLGSYNQALILATGALELARLYGTPQDQAYTLVLLSQINSTLGRVHEGFRRLAQARRQARGDPRILGYAGRVRGELLLKSGAPRRAVEDLDEVLALNESLGYHLAFGATLAIKAEILEALGRAAEALETAENAIHRLEHVSYRLPLQRAYRCAHRLTRGRKYTDAIRSLERTGALVARRVEGRRKHHGSGIKKVRDRRGPTSGDGFIRVVERLSGRLGPVSGRAIDANVPLSRPQSHKFATPLTPREVELARLVVAGYSNRAIADSLGVTQGTVANHLQSIFSRCGIRARWQLTEELVEGV